MRMLAVSNENCIQECISLLKSGESDIVFVADDGYSLTVNFPPYDSEYSDEELSAMIEQFLDDSMEDNASGHYDA